MTVRLMVGADSRRIIDDGDRAGNGWQAGTGVMGRLNSEKDRLNECGCFELSMTSVGRVLGSGGGGGCRLGCRGVCWKERERARGVAAGGASS